MLLPLRLAARPLALALALAAPALPAVAQDRIFDPAEMTAEEREAFRAEVRDYLMENPEVLMEAFQVLEARQAEAEAAFDAQAVLENAVELREADRSWTGGNPEGDITVVEFIDYRCSFCRRAFPEVEELVASDGNIRIVVKEFPILGEQSVLASRFAIASLQLEGEEAYKRVHDALIAWPGDMNDLAFELIAADLGLDYGPIGERMQSEEVTAVIAANHELAQKLNISGTPTFVIGDELIRGYLPLGGMREIVEEARAEG